MSGSNRREAKCLYWNDGQPPQSGDRQRRAFEQGHEREKLDEVYTPIGLKIGAETPEEIAVSVMAEIIQVKHEKAEGCGYSKELLEALCDEDCKKQKKYLQRSFPEKDLHREAWEQKC